MTLRLPYKIKSYNYVSVQTTNHYHKKTFREKVYKEFYTLNSKTIDIWDKSGVIRLAHYCIMFFSVNFLIAGPGPSQCTVH